MNEDQRELLIEEICDQIVKNMSSKELMQIVWDRMSDELHELSEEDLDLYAQDYGVEL